MYRNAKGKIVPDPSNQTRAAATTGAAAAAALDAAPPRKERNPVAGFSCSSRKRSSGTLKAPWTQTAATPTRRAEMRSDPTVVRKTTKRLVTLKMPRVSLSEKVRPKRTRGWSDGRKR